MQSVKCQFDVQIQLFISLDKGEITMNNIMDNDYIARSVCLTLRFFICIREVLYYYFYVLSSFNKYNHVFKSLTLFIDHTNELLLTRSRCKGQEQINLIAFISSKREFGGNCQSAAKISSIVNLG